MTPRHYVTKERLETIAAELRPLDWELLNEVARFRLTSTQQLQRIHYGPSTSDSRRCRRRLNQLVELGALDRLPRRVGGRGRGSDSSVLRIGRAGQRLLAGTGGAGPAWQPSAAFAAHTLGIVDLYVELHEQCQLARLKLIEFTPEPGAWRKFTWQMKPATLKPDAFTIVKLGGMERHYFIELDRGTESMKVIGNKIGRYLDYYHSGPDLEVFPQVLFLVDAEKSYHCKGTLVRVAQIARTATDSLPADLQALVTVAAKNHPPWATATDNTSTTNET